MKYLSIFLVVQMICLPIVFAEETIIIIKKGTPAPFDGSLLSPEAIVKILSEKEYQDKKCALDKEYELAKQKVKCDLDLNKCQVEKDICNQKFDSINKIKDEEIKKLNELVVQSEKKNSYSNWYFIGGMMVGIVVAIGSSFAIYYGSQR